MPTMIDEVNLRERFHPHERDGRNERAVIDKDGRCLVCCRDEMIRLQATVAALTAENAALLGELSQIANRVSPAAGPCSCPEFCLYHAREVFDTLTATIVALRGGTGRAERAVARLDYGEAMQVCRDILSAPPPSHEPAVTGGEELVRLTIAIENNEHDITQSLEDRCFEAARKVKSLLPVMPENANG